MIRAVSLLVAATLAAMPIVASAQIEGERKPTGFTLNARETDQRAVGADTSPYVVLAMTARCLADRRSDSIRAYLASIPGSEAESAAYAAFEERVPNCMPRNDFSDVGNMQRARGTLSLTFSHASMRGALAEAMMREEDIVLEPARLALGDDGMYAAELFHRTRSSDTARVFTLGFAGCVMGNNSDRIERLLSSEPGSSDERAAILDMADSFGNCVMEGQTLSINPSILRNQLAEVVYYAMQIGNSDA